MQCSGTGVSGMDVGMVFAVFPFTRTVYDVMGVPPSDNGGSHVKCTLFTSD